MPNCSLGLPKALVYSPIHPQQRPLRSEAVALREAHGRPVRIQNVPETGRPGMSPSSAVMSLTATEWEWVTTGPR